nr:hypothetical protein [Tanacetum cinerariifolium]
MLNLKDIIDPTTIINIALVLMAKAFQLNYSTPTNNNQRISSNPCNRKIAQPGMNMGQDRQMQMVGGDTRAEGNAIRNNGNQIRCYNCKGLGHLARNCTVRLRRGDVALDLDKIEEVKANCILMAKLQRASTSGTQTDKAPVYDSDGSADYTELLEPIPKPHKVQQNDSNVIYEVSSVEQDGGIVNRHFATIKEIRAYFESLYNNLAIKVEKVNTVNHTLREANADLTTELARYKNQDKCFEISQEKYDKLERSYQKSVYQEQCLTKKINALHLSFSKQITILNEEISNLNNQLSKEKSIVSSLLREKKRLKSDFKIHEDELLDKQIQLKNKIKELDNIFVKTGFKSLAKEADESLFKHNALELEIERLLIAVFSQDIMSIVQSNSVVDILNLQTELDHMKE